MDLPGCRKHGGKPEGAASPEAQGDGRSLAFHRLHLDGALVQQYGLLAQALRAAAANPARNLRTE
jgi:hypothetical protein